MTCSKLYRKIMTVIAACAVTFVMVCAYPAMTAKAAGGTVYTCTINRCYKHPVTGIIEDAGGEASYATGQGMVEGCVYPTGMLEVTDSGEYYLTIRMSLMDYTSGHSFWVQNAGDSDWTSPALGQTGSGTDNNGTTADITIQVPSENCVVRGSMYVEPMGRDVIFYVYPSDFTEGNTTDMTPAMVTSASGSGDAQASQSQDGGNDSQADQSQVSYTAGTDGLSQDGGVDAQTEQIQAGTPEDQGSKSVTASASSCSGSTSSANNLQSTVSQQAATAASTSETAEVSKAEGLSLSTAQSSSSKTSNKSNSSTDGESGDSGSGNRVFQIALAVAVDGLILIGVTAAVVYFFRRNWRRWGGEEDDDE